MGWTEYMRRMQLLQQRYDGPIPAKERKWMEAGLALPEPKEEFPNLSEKERPANE